VVVSLGKGDLASPLRHRDVIDDVDGDDVSDKMIAQHQSGSSVISMTDVAVSIRYCAHQPQQGITDMSIMASRLEASLLQYNSSARVSGRVDAVSARKASSHCVSKEHAHSPLNVSEKMFLRSAIVLPFFQVPALFPDPPYAQWSSAKSLVDVVFEQAAIVAWKNIFSHTAMDDYKQSMLTTETEREDRLARVAHRNGVILSCYDKASEQEWLASAKTNIGIVTKVYYPPNCDDQAWMRQAYEFTVDFLFQCFPVSSLQECVEYLVVCGLYVLLVRTFITDVAHALPTTVSSNCCDWVQASGLVEWKQTLLTLLEHQASHFIGSSAASSSRVAGGIPLSAPGGPPSGPEYSRSITARDEDDDEFTSETSAGDDERRTSASSDREAPGHSRPESRLAMLDKDDSETDEEGADDGDDAGLEAPRDLRATVQGGRCDGAQSPAATDEQEEDAPASRRSDRPASVSKEQIWSLAIKLAVGLFDIRLAASTEIPTDC
jgi:hypothetical protein